MRRQGRTGGFRPLQDKPHISPLFARAGESITHSRLLPHLALYSALRSVYSELIDVSQAPASSPAPRRRSRAKDPHPPPSTTARPGRPAPAPEAQGTVRRPAVVIRGVRPLRAARPHPGAARAGPPPEVGARSSHRFRPAGSPGGSTRGPTAPAPHPRGRSPTTGAATAPGTTTAGQRRTSAPEGAPARTQDPSAPRSAPGTPRWVVDGSTGSATAPAATADRTRRPAHPTTTRPARQHPTGADDMETGGTSDR